MDRERIGNLVRARRLKVGLKQEDVAEAVGMKKAAISHIELARNGSSTDTLVDIATVLQAKWEIRLIGVGEEPARSAERQELIDLVDLVVDRLKDRELHYLLGIVRLYAAEPPPPDDLGGDGIQSQSKR